MIILEEPYVSGFLQDTLKRMQIPVLYNNAVQNMNLSPELNYFPPEKFITEYKNKANIPLYSSSENALDWIIKNLGSASNLHHSNLSRQIKLFKDKFLFRSIMQAQFPNFHFTKVAYSELLNFDISSLSFPVIIKPNIGFFSVAVYRINSADEWNSTVSAIISEMKNLEGVFPSTVVNAAEFIIEDVIEGDEFAVDVYFDQHSQPVILNIMKHIFANPKDTSDRLYITSKEIIESTHDSLSSILQEIGKRTQIKLFPLHIEVRINSQGDIGIIEANPMRFAGLCVTDLAYYAYGSNNYELFFKQQKPDWKHLLNGKDGKIYAMIVGTLPRDLPLEHIEYVDYQAFCSKLSHVLECREMDVHKFPLFTITFAEFDKYDKSSMDEMNWALHSDFGEFFILKNK
ncbi:MAG: ATP-grasp domain-containing protein [Candidatus Lokiarchaeota archaeon]|nr:ATP-grasp domain-containing protein [Candidatus Harpocratesius repetitus]